MAKKKGGAGRVAKAAGGAAGVSTEAAPAREFNQGDLVLAKVKGWPAWPAQIVKLETEGKHQGKYYVTYFGPGQQIGWCLPGEVSDFDAEQREAAIQKSQKKTADKKFISAVKEICAVQDERAGITHKDSGDENEEENGELAEDDARLDSGLEGQEDDMTKEGDQASDVKHGTYLTQVTLNQQDDSIPLNDGNPEEDVEDDAADKDWSEKAEYNGSGAQTGREWDESGVRADASPGGAGGEAAKAGGDVEDEDSEANGGTWRAFRNALKRINETAEKEPEAKREVVEGEVPVLTYQYGRKKNRNKNNNLDGSAIVNGGGASGGQAIVEESAPPAVESSEVEKKMKPKVGRPSKASQQAKMGVRDGKTNVEATKKASGGERESKSERGNGGNRHEGSGKFAKDGANNGHSKKGPYMKKKDVQSSSVMENRERKSEDKKDVKRVASEADRVKKGPKKPLTSTKSSLEEGKKQSGAAKRGEEDVTDEFERKVKSAFSGFHGGSKSKGDVKGEGSLKRRRLIDGESEGEEGDGWTEGRGAMQGRVLGRIGMRSRCRCRRGRRWWVRRRSRGKGSRSRDPWGVGA